MITSFLKYIISQKTEIINLLIQHIELTSLSVFISILVGVPLGVLVSYVKKINKPILGFANIIQAIPSMALLGFAIPFLGIGQAPAIVMVILYSLLPIIKNTYTGLSNINPQMLEAAKGIGLTKIQRLFRIQMPLALPVIMSGIRISAVTAVGLMTIAAYVGAGGLGYMVFSGIRTVNNYQILAGAIPACILALFVDYLFSLVEKIVTPISLQLNILKKKQNVKSERIRQRIILASALFVIIAIFISKGLFVKSNNNERNITLGTMVFTEQFIIGNMIATYIEENTDISVNRKFGLGATQIVFGALTKGDIDLYIEYTGTIYSRILKHSPTNDVDYVYNQSKIELKEMYDIEMLKEFGFNNTYVLAIRPDTSKDYNIKTISDLIPHADKLIFSGTLEFLNREDGIIGLTNKYNLRFKSLVGIEDAPKYIAITTKNTDVVTAFSTDGLLKKFDLVSLKDDQNFFPPYYAVPIIRADTLKKYPELSGLLERLGDLLTEDVMLHLNYLVDEKQEDASKVAYDFLIENNLIK